MGAEFLLINTLINKEKNMENKEIETVQKEWMGCTVETQEAVVVKECSCLFD